MWVYTRARHEHDPRFLINLDHYPSIAVNQLGERFFVDAGTGGETATLASANTAEEASGFVRHLFAALESGTIAIDLGTVDPGAPPRAEAARAEARHPAAPAAIVK